MANATDIKYGIPPSGSNTVDWLPTEDHLHVVSLNGSIDRMMTLTRVASGDIVAGDGIMLNSNGTFDPAGIGPDIISDAITSGPDFYLDAAHDTCYDSVNDKWILVYSLLAGVYTVTMTLSGDTIIFGVPNLVYDTEGAVSWTSVSCDYDPVNEKVVIGFPDNRGLAYDRFWIIVGNVIPGATPDLDTLSFGAAVGPLITIKSIYSSSVLYDPDTGLMLCGMCGTGSVNERATVFFGEVSGSSITLAPQSIIATGIHSTIKLLYDTVNKKVAAFHSSDDSYTSVGTVTHTGELSAATITWGSSVRIGGGSIIFAVFGSDFGHDTTNNKFVFAGYKTSTQQYTNVGYISGDSFVWSTMSLNFGGLSYPAYHIKHDTVNDKILVLYTNKNTRYIETAVGQIDHSTNTISFLPPTVLSSYRTWYEGAFWDTVGERFVVYYSDGDNTNPSLFYYYRIDSSNVNQEGFLGIAQNSASAGQEVVTGRYGFLDTNQTGLTLGAVYLEDDGSFVSYDTGTYAGLAVTSTKLLIKG